MIKRFILGMMIVGTGVPVCTARADTTSDLDANDLAVPKQAASAAPVPAKPNENPLLKNWHGVGSDTYIEDLELQGVAVSTKDKAALVSNHLLRVGNEIAGYQVVSIERDEVVLRDNDQEVTLHLKPF